MFAIMSQTLTERLSTTGTVRANEDVELVAEIAAGLGHIVARRSNGSVVAWGLNWYGECDVPPKPGKSVTAKPPRVQFKLR